MPFVEQQELIETLWNVNNEGTITNLTDSKELIETYWNVDYYHN